MAKFSKYLTTHLVHEWTSKYVRYKALKKLIKQINEEHKAAQSPQANQEKHHSILSFDRLLTFIDEPLASFHHLNQNFGINQNQTIDETLQDEEVELLELHPDHDHHDGSSQQLDLDEHKESPNETDVEYSIASSLKNKPDVIVESLDESQAQSVIRRSFLLNSPTPAELRFVAMLKEDLVNIEQFYLQQQTLLLTRASEWCNAAAAYSANTSQANAISASRLVDACRRLYQLLHRLHNYRILCYIALCKIVKKHDKSNEYNHLSKELAMVLDQLQAFKSNAVQNCMKRITFAYAHNFTDDNLSEARQQLEPPATKPISQSAIQRLVGLLTACIIAIFLFFLQIGIIAVGSDHVSESILSFLPTYRLIGMLLIHSLLWTVCLFCLQRTRINYQLILELDPFSATPIAKMATFLLSLILSFLTIGNLYVFMWLLASHNIISETSAGVGAFSITFSFFVIVMMVVFNPFDVGLAAARRYMFGVFRTVLGTPFTRVTYQATFLANQGTSLSECLPDLSFSFCSFFRAFTPNSFEPNSIGQPMIVQDFCTDFNHHYIAWWLTSIPNAWRCMQCWKRWRAGAGIRNLGNAYKYGNRLVVAFFDGMYTYQLGGASGSTANNVFFGLWLTFALVNVTYSYYWDVVQDWGLFKHDSPRKWPLLRAQLMIAQPYYYYVAMGLNAVFRIISGMSLSRSIFFGRYATTSLFATFLFECESLRRSLWNFFRLENEHLNNVEKFRAVDLLPVPTVAA